MLVQPSARSIKTLTKPNNLAQHGKEKPVKVEAIENQNPLTGQLK